MIKAKLVDICVSTKKLKWERVGFVNFEIAVHTSQDNSSMGVSMWQHSVGGRQVDMNTCLQTHVHMNMLGPTRVHVNTGQHLLIDLFDSQQQTMVVQGGGAQDGQNCPWKPPR